MNASEVKELEKKFLNYIWIFDDNNDWASVKQFLLIFIENLISKTWKGFSEEQQLDISKLLKAKNKPKEIVEPDISRRRARQHKAFSLYNSLGDVSSIETKEFAKEELICCLEQVITVFDVFDPAYPHRDDDIIEDITVAYEEIGLTSAIVLACLEEAALKLNITVK